MRSTQRRFRRHPHFCSAGHDALHLPVLPPPQPAPKRSGIITRLATGLITSVLLGSIALNIWLGVFFVSSMKVGPHEVTYAEGDTANRIVVLPIVGTIGDESASFVRQSLRTLRTTGKPAALVLRVESPGGGVGASDRIWHEIQKYREDTGVPIVASYGDVAASGGYYVSCHADHIFAEPTTLTGSIGVMFMAFNVESMMKKIGVEATILTAETSPEKDLANNSFRAWTEADRKVVQPFLDQTHELFMKRVLDGRRRVLKDLTEEQVRQVATGRVYSADQALALHLIDAEGYLEDALQKAGELAQIDPKITPQVTIIKAQGGLLQQLGITHSGGLPDASWSAQRVRTWLLDVSMPQMEYRWQPQQ
ncbi:MAG: signal peptide peptidase SppA [Phycisphaerales bacterium]|nr:signal peptide peptidase SppA [Phycisphaerales bacterium]